MQQLSFWLYGTLADVVPYPPRDRYFYNKFPRVDQLADADPTLQPISAEGLPQAQSLAMFWVQYRGGAIPHFSDPGLERLRGNILNQRAFQEGKALEVSAAEEEALRALWGGDPPCDPPGVPLEHDTHRH